MQLETIVFYILLADSVIANIVAWLGARWYNRKFSVFARYFPMAKGWTTFYLLLVLFTGWILYSNGSL